MKAILVALSVAGALYAAEIDSVVKSCTACHGPQGEKKALGTSEPFDNKPEEAIREALLKYKNDPSYGGGKKTIMQGQMKRFDEATIEKIAKYYVDNRPKGGN